MGSAERLQHLLATGRVRKSSALLREHIGSGRHNTATWELAELAGRVVELGGGGGVAAATTVAVSLVLEAQQLGEPVAWVTRRSSMVSPTDVADNGVDLRALVFVHITEEAGRAGLAMLRAADQLLRSGAFGLVLLDLPERVDVPLPAQVRLAGLAKKHDAALVCLTSRGPLSSKVQFASLRAESERRRAGAGRFECVLRIRKDKRRGQRWEHVQVFRGAMGLR